MPGSRSRSLVSGPLVEGPTDRRRGRRTASVPDRGCRCYGTIDFAACPPVRRKSFRHTTNVIRDILTPHRPLSFAVVLQEFEKISFCVKKNSLSAFAKKKSYAYPKYFYTYEYVFIRYVCGPPPNVRLPLGRRKTIYADTHENMESTRFRLFAIAQHVLRFEMLLLRFLYYFFFLFLYNIFAIKCVICIAL